MQFKNYDPFEAVNSFKGGQYQFYLLSDYTASEIPIPDLSAMVEQLEQWITMHKQGLKERKRHLKDMSARQKEVYDRDLKVDIDIEDLFCVEYIIYEVP